jgi:undecaprenyl-diphosphatase
MSQDRAEEKGDHADVCTIVAATSAGGSILGRPHLTAEVKVTSRPKDPAEPQIPAGTQSKGPLQSQRGSPLGAVTMTVVVGFFALLACLLVLGTLAAGIRDQEVFTMDTVATPFLHGLASPALDAVMNGLTLIGSDFVIVPLFIVAVIGLVRVRRRREALFLAVASVGSLILNATMKVFFQRPRPQLAYAQVLPDYSFPSGHTMNSLVFYVALAIVLWAIFGRRVGAIAVPAAVVLAVFVGISRIYLGYHYFTDVLGALLAGAGWLLVVGAAFRTGPLYNLWREAAPAAATGADAPSRKRA